MFYHLGELDDALSYALGAGKLFDINEQSEYVQTTLGAPLASLLAFTTGKEPCCAGTLLGRQKAKACSCALCMHADRCIDQYVELRNKPTEDGAEPVLDERLVAIVERLFERCGAAARAHAALLQLPTYIWNDYLERISPGLLLLPCAWLVLKA